MKIVLLEEAQRRFEAEDTWWRENREVKALFIEEFSAVLGQISSMPEVGQRYRRTRGKVRALPKPPPSSIRPTSTHAYQRRERSKPFRANFPSARVQRSVPLEVIASAPKGFEATMLFTRFQLCPLASKLAFKTSMECILLSSCCRRGACRRTPEASDASGSAVRRLHCA